MSRYFFHLRSRAGILTDDEGCEYLTTDAAISASYSAARELMAAEIVSGALDLHQSVLIAGRDGKVLREVTFVEALDFENAEDGKHALTCPIFSSLKAGTFAVEGGSPAAMVGQCEIM